MPRMDGMELLQRLSDQPQQIAVVLLTAQGSIDVAVDAMKAGAYDFIQKPVDPARLKQILQNASRQRGTTLELEATKTQAARYRPFRPDGGLVQGQCRRSFT